MLLSTVQTTPTPTTAWQLGIDRYISTIPLKHQADFRKPADADDCMKWLQQASGKGRKFDRLVLILRPLIEPLKKFEASVDVLVQTYSTIASPVWGPLRVVLTLLADRLSTLTLVATLLERLVEPLKRFQNYEVLFQNNESLQRAIAALYCDLIEFCTRVVCHLDKNPLLRAFGSFDRDVAEISDKIHHHWNEVDITANAANFDQAQAARETDSVFRTLELRRAINLWLAPTNAADDVQLLQELYAAGSCDWVVETDAFISFLDLKQRPNAIRLTGLPGGGKSTAASFLVRKLQSLQRYTVLYFFCKAVDAEKSFVLNIVRTWIWQLLQEDESLYEYALPAYRRSGRGIADSEAEIFAVFRAVMDKHSRTPVVVILDALDECQDALKLLPLIESETSWPVLTNLIVSSRDDTALRPVFDACNYCINLASKLEPLQMYIKRSVSVLDLPLDSHTRDLISEKIVNGSNGLWLFARLILEDIAGAPNAEQIQVQLNAIPTGLSQMYTSMLRKKEAKFSKTQLAMAQQLYLWIDLRIMSPVVDIFSRQHGVRSISDDVITAVLHFALRSNSLLLRPPMAQVQDLCSPIIHTRILHEDFSLHFSGGSSSAEHPMFVAELFHQTAQQYLSWLNNQSYTSTPITLRPRRLSVLHRGACAAWYFVENQQFQAALQHLRERPRSGKFDCWREMDMTLLSCLWLDKLRDDLESCEIAEAGAIISELCEFLTGRRCFDWLETRFILDFADPFMTIYLLLRLYCNADLDRWSSNNDNSDSVLSPLLDARRVFFEDLVYVLTLNLPAEATTTSHAAGIFPSARSFTERPTDFDKRPVACKMETLARQYQWLLLPPGAKSCDSFMINLKS